MVTKFVVVAVVIGVVLAVLLFMFPTLQATITSVDTTGESPLNASMSRAMPYVLFAAIFYGGFLIWKNRG